MRRTASCRILGRLPCSWSILLFVISTLTVVSSQLTTLLLHPTSERVNERRSRRSLKKVNETLRLLKQTRNSAVYATLADERDEGISDVEKDFHLHRHLSRYERAFREREGLDLQLDWNGTYSHQENRRIEEYEHIRHSGSYSHYQAVPLSQGYGTHYAHLWVGTPKAQRQSVIVDTGSHYTAFPCRGCNNCGEEHHTDPYFEPGLSSSFRPLPCHNCQLGATCKGFKCVFSQSYTEGSSWEAYQVEDVLHLGGNDFLASVDPSTQGYAIPFMFGCQTSENGLFVTQLADGIMGMSAHEMTITKQLYDRKKIPHKVFSLCFRRELATSKKGVTAGVMTLGGMDTRFDSSPMIYAKNTAKSGWFTVYVNNILIRSGGGQSATSKTERDQHVFKIPLNLVTINSGKGVIVDSGTTDTYLHKIISKPFVSIWKQVTKREYTHNGIALTDDQVRRLPTILVQCRALDYGDDPSRSSPKNEDIVGYAGSLDPMAPFDLLIAIPASNYMEYSPVTNLYTSRLYFTETQGGVLGANAMQGHNVVFDWENGLVGFAESSCEYEDKYSLENLGVLDESRGKRHKNDCSLKPPVLSKTCIDSVDSNICRQKDETTMKLQGKETWTYLVENPGSSHGMACADVVLLESTYKGPMPPQAECNGEGLCMEYRPCEVSCVDVVEKNDIIIEPSMEYCPGPYSACDFQCSQSFLSAFKKSDGTCYEIKRSSRPCHKDACGGNDPCRVPYLVQASIGLRGAKGDLWFPYTEELLANAIVNSIHHKLSEKQSYFKVGDVKIMMITRWFDQPESKDSIASELGVKVVFQISFFNPNAQVLADIIYGNETVDDQDIVGNTMNTVAGTVKTMFGRPQQVMTTCIENDLYPLARQAHEVHSVLNDEGFMGSLLGELKKSEGGDRKFDGSPFQEMYNHHEFVSDSLVFASWTVRTELKEVHQSAPSGILPQRIRQYAFNWNFIVGFSCMALCFFAWLWENCSKGTSSKFIGCHWNQMKGAKKHCPTHPKNKLMQTTEDEQLFVKLFQPKGMV